MKSLVQRLHRISFAFIVLVGIYRIDAFRRPRLLSFYSAPPVEDQRMLRSELRRCLGLPMFRDSRLSQGLSK